MMKKKELRSVYLAKQKALHAEERREMSAQVSERLFSDFDLLGTRYLHLFLSMESKNELDTSPIVNELWDNFVNVKTVVPRVNSDEDRLEHLEFNSGSKLAVSNWGIAEPIGRDLIDERKIDVVLVPMLCFDKEGYRVGYGKGFYDKFLANCRTDCQKIGLCYFDPVVEIEDVENFDVAIDYCITPMKTLEF